jgi:CheY-like chemotaxis protein
VEFAQTIHSAGNDLLSLINDILDLSKVEAGRMEVDTAPIALSDIYEDAERAFRQMAEQNGLDFKVDIDPALPPSIVSDEQRLNQVLKNLLSNAFKFTHRGRVTLSIGHPSEGTTFRSETLQAADRVVAFTVTDTGVGIADDKLGAIFEAFQQADGTTSRKYGGTGLGLSISREIARLLGGEIHVESRLGAGSRFSLLLPLNERVVETALPEVADEELATTRVASNGGAPAGVQGVPGTEDKGQFEPDDRVVLVIDPDSDRARAVVDTLRERGAKAIVDRRPTAALGLAREHRPQAVLLAGGPARVETALGQLKKHPDTRHVPVVVIADPAGRIDALRAGAAAFVEEPVDAARLEIAIARLERLTAPARRRVALVTEQEQPVEQIVSLLSGAEAVEFERIELEGAFAALRAEPFDLGVVVVRRGAREQFRFLQDVATDEAVRELPLIVYIQGALAKTDRARLDALSKSAVITVADSPERLVDRTALFLHRVEATLPTSTRRMLGQLRTGDAPLHGKKVLVVDDDIRNVFALTSSLEQRGMKVVYAENGREGIERLHQHPNTDLVLLDIMMPEMDGYETARAIRAMPRFEHLPIISLTAKAMKGDREKALAAGASDYITKPVDLDHLVSMMRVWLDS